MPRHEIYLIGICGVAMGSLAALLSDAGHSVTGSDSGMYPPMDEFLKTRGIRVFTGFQAEQVGRPDLVVVGNAISRGNPELEYVLNERIPYLSMAQALHRFFLSGKDVVAVAGTHGKSTTTALLAHILGVAGLDPSFFIGGVALNYHTTCRIGSGPFFILEADEYDSAFFEKVPKFMIYRPQHALLTSLEFDHADIYRDSAEIELWFRRLINIIPSRGCAIYSRGYEALGRVAAGAPCRTLSFGEGGDFRRSEPRLRDGKAWFSIEHAGGSFEVSTSLFGGFNFDNILAAASMALRLGVDERFIRQGVADFHGVRRRQELIYDNGRVRIYEDFAHHPTAVKGMIDAVRERHPSARVYAAFEPRSATSRRRVFQELFPSSFSRADRVAIMTPYKGGRAIPSEEMLDADKLVRDINSLGVIARLFSDVGGIIDWFIESADNEEECVIVIMSNGGFDGIYGRIREAFDSHSGAVTAMRN